LYQAKQGGKTFVACALGGERLSSDLLPCLLFGAFWIALDHTMFFAFRIFKEKEDVRRGI
jgi:hypothetical protein